MTASVVHVDSHAHLDVADFDPDREAVIARAEDANVRHLLLIADLTKPESVRKVIELAECHPGMYWAAGIDPHEATVAREGHYKLLAEIARHPKFLAVGEIGLDYFYDYPRDVQHRIFLHQLDLARDLRKPVIIHCRDSWTDLRQIMHQRVAEGMASSVEREDSARTGVLHCF